MATNPSSITHAAWGVSATGVAPYASCVVTDWNDTEEAQHQYEYDNLGAVVGDTVYDRRSTITATFQIPSTIEAPSTGTIVSVNSKSYILLNISTVQSNRDYRKATVTLERYGNDVTPSLVGGAATGTSSAS